MLLQFYLVCLIFGGGVVNAVSEVDDIAKEWYLFKIQYGKTYDTFFEEEYRFKIFKENKYRVAEHNQLFTQGIESYETGINQFSDMLPNEVVTGMSGLTFTNDLYEAMNKYEMTNYTYNWCDTRKVPKDFDWTTKGVVTAVKDQGNCISSWAFAAVGAVEAQQIIHKSRYISLSVQNLIDCSQWNAECNGGWPIRALEYIKNNSGIDTERSYPYTGKYNKVCKFRRNKLGAKVRDIFRTSNNERCLMSLIFNHGPVAVSININDPDFHAYKSGVYDNENCSKVPNHSVLIVGYGIDKEHDYWLVKNSWGTNWGIKGYMKIERNRNMCGIADNGVYATI